MKKTVIVAICLCSAVPASATLIDFELGGPGLFAQANPLREEYASLGAHFTGPGPLDGGAALNARNGAFGSDPVSGDDVLAFNINAKLKNGGVPKGPETITFDSVLSSVSVYYSGGPVNSSTGRMQAFDASNHLLGQVFVASTYDAWKKLSLSGIGNIAYVTVDTVGSSVFLLDDLEFQAVPEPSSLVVMGTGAAIASFARRRRRARRGQPTR